MRQISPLSPAFAPGAQRILTIGVASLNAPPWVRLSAAMNPRWGVAGHAMASVFHDTLSADVERAQRMTRTLRQFRVRQRPCCLTDLWTCWPCQPGQSLDDLAQVHAHALPPAVRHVLGGLARSKAARAGQLFAV